jgi:hypothetical protein
MHVCSQCKNRIPADEDLDTFRPFPACTVAAGLVGSALGVATGAFLFVPAALVLGAAADVRHCGICGEQLAADDAGFRLMEEETGPSGNSYTPAARPAPVAGSRPASMAGRPIAPRAQEAPTGQSERPSLFGTERTADEDSDPARETYVYDELQGGLVPAQPAPEEDLADSWDTGGLDGQWESEMDISVDVPACFDAPTDSSAEFGPREVGPGADLGEDIGLGGLLT